MRRFECTEGGSNKFWEITIEGTEVVTRHGAIGGKGRETRKDAGSAEAAEKLHAKLIREKTGKGYVEVEEAATPAQASAAPGATAERSLDAEPAKKAAPKKTPAAKPAGIQPFERLDAKQVGKVASSLERRKRGHLPALETATPELDESARARLLVHLLRHDRVGLPSIELVRLLARHVDALDDADLRAMLTKLPEDTIALEDYASYERPVAVTEGIVAELLPLLGGAAERLGSEIDALVLGPNVQRGLALGARLRNVPVAEAVRDELFRHVVSRLTTSKIDAYLELALFDPDGASRKISLRVPADVVALLARLGPESGWRAPYLALLRDRGCGTLSEPVVVEGFRDAPLGEVEEQLALYDLHASALIAARDDAPDALYELARRAKSGRLATSIAVRAAGRSDTLLPTDLDERIELSAFDYRNREDGIRMLRRMGIERCDAIGRRTLAQPQGDLWLISVLGTHFSPAFLESFFDALESSCVNEESWRNVITRLTTADAVLLELLVARAQRSSGHTAWAYRMMLMHALPQVIADAPPELDDHVDPRDIRRHDDERLFRGVVNALPPDRAEQLLLRFLDTIEPPVRVVRYLREGLSSGLARRVAELVVAMREDADLPIELNSAQLKALGDRFGEVLADAIGAASVPESFVNQLRHRLTPSALELLVARLAEQTVGVLDEMRSLAAALPGPHRRIYLLSRGASPLPDDAIARVGGLPRGVAPDAVPRHGKRKMVHLLTFDLAQMPELAARWPSKRSLSIFAQYYTENLTRGSALVPQDDAEIGAQPGSIAGACALALEPLDVPEAIFGPQASDDASDELRRLKHLVYGAPGFALGGPLWMHEDGPIGVDDSFVLQLSDSLIHGAINLGDFGDLYVFEDRALWSSH